MHARGATLAKPHFRLLIRVYAISCILISPSASSLTSNLGAVVPIGVDRYAVGDDNGIVGSLLVS